MAYSEDVSTDHSSFGPEDGVPNEDLFEDEEVNDMDNDCDSRNDSFSYEVDTFSRAASQTDFFGDGGVSLSGADATIAEQYRFMLQMGLPKDAVLAKMMEAKVKPHIMTVVLNPSNYGLNTRHVEAESEQESEVEVSYTSEGDHSRAIDEEEEEHEEIVSHVEEEEEETQEEVTEEEEQEESESKIESQSSNEQEQVEERRAVDNFDYTYVGRQDWDMSESSRERDPLMEMTESGMSVDSLSTSHRENSRSNILEQLPPTEEVVEEASSSSSSSVEELTVLEEEEIFRDEPHQNDVEQPLPRKPSPRKSQQQRDEWDAPIRRTTTIKEERNALTVRKQFAIVMMLVTVMCLALITVVGVILGIYLSDNDDDGDGNDDSKSGDLTDSFPTLSPTISPKGPTASPAPTTSGSGNNTTPDPPDITMKPQQTFSGPVRSNFGHSAVSEGNWVAIGMPLDNDGSGAVATYRRSVLSNIGSDSNDSFQIQETLVGLSQGSRYGASLAFSNPVANNPFLVVGAPMAPATISNLAVGAAYFYAYDRRDQQWKLEGTNMTGGAGLASQGEAFGTSVAASDSYRVVVGAPLYGGNDAGRVYTFGFGQILNTTEFDWQSLAEDAPLVGNASNALFGSAVDLTPDGNTLVVGAPGMSRFEIFDWDDATSEWTSSFSLTRSDAVHLGSKVTFLSPNYIAVGAPSAQSSMGLAVVFQRQDNNTWTQVGNDIEGDTEQQRLGSALSGQEGPDGVQLIAGTAKGEIRRFDFVSGTWVERYTVSVGSLAHDITSVDVVDAGITAAGATSVVVGLASADMAIVLSETMGFQSPSTDSTDLREISLNIDENDNLDGDGGFGHSISWAGNILAVGMPLYESKGGVQPFQLPSGGGEFVPTDLVVETTAGSSSTTRFGSSVDLGSGTNGKIRMAAALTGTQNTLSYAAAYCFEYNDDDGVWDQIGGIISDEAPVEVGGKYGPTVAIASAIRRVALGVPSGGASLAMSTGRISTYDYSGSQWEEVSPGPLTGTAGSYMGASMDMSSDGNRLVVGSPGVRGNVQCFKWAPGLWLEIASISGVSADAFGTSVAFMDSKGSQFVAGAPDFFSKRGAVRVYGQSTITGAFTPVGNQILGNPGEMIGTTVCGKNDRIAFGTSTGAFHVYDFDGTSWIKLKSGAATNSAVVSIAMSDDGNSIAVGYADEELKVFALSDDR